MLLLHAMDGGWWGICSPPIARIENRPHPEAWTWLGGGAMRVPARPRYEPKELPAAGSNDWRTWEQKMRRRFIEEYNKPGVMAPARPLGFWDCEVIHPDDELLLEAARIIWNGELQEMPDAVMPRVWQWEKTRTWWLIGLPAPLDAETVRAMVRAQRAHGA